jgi:hypothetical protein
MLFRPIICPCFAPARLDHLAERLIARQRHGTVANRRTVCPTKIHDQWLIGVACNHLHRLDPAAVEQRRCGCDTLAWFLEGEHKRTNGVARASMLPR